MKGWTAGILLFVSGFAFLPGCVSIEKSYPDRRYFVLDLRHSGGTNPAAETGVLQIAPVRISPRYADRNFIYRRSETRYETDYYNQFLVSPGVLVSEEVRREFSDSGLFRYVIGPAQPLVPTHTLDSAVNSFYGDFRDVAAPKAVIEMEFFLSRESPGAVAVLFHNQYQRIVAVNARNPEALVQGWNQALQGILDSLVNDLKAVDLQPKSP
jgi:cholesterol transport system auxiliary component